MTITPSESAVPVQPTPAATPPPGWYADPNSPMQRWWDGIQWTEHYQPVPTPVVHTTGPMTAGSLKVNREVSYVRQQQGHSIILHLFLGLFVLWINVIYITVSPNHYWHA